MFFLTCKTVFHRGNIPFFFDFRTQGWGTHLYSNTSDIKRQAARSKQAAGGRKNESFLRAVRKLGFIQRTVKTVFL